MYKSKYTTQHFIQRAKSIHGEKYDYSKVVYAGSYEPVIITCKIHGDFIQKPYSHLSNHGCKRCQLDMLNNLGSNFAVDFTNKAKLIHGVEYDYSKVSYKNRRSPVIIVCKTHGDFMQTPYGHLAGNKCPQCSAYNGQNASRGNTSDFIVKAKLVHNGKYDYSKVSYKNTNTKVKIICPTHGEFEQTPHSHLKNHGCKSCYADSKSNNTNDFIERASMIHGNKFDYSNVDYVGVTQKVKIICPTHGEFEQSPQSHYFSGGCPKCSVSSSKPEMVTLLSKTTTQSIINNYRDFGFEIDAYIPDLKIGFEFNGNYWHSEINKNKLYHQHKTLKCKELGIRLLHIWEHEWSNGKIKTHIENLLSTKQRVFARKCQIKEVPVFEERSFLDLNHLQGYNSSTICYGLYLDDCLIQLMSFKKHNVWEIQRLSTRYGYLVIGGSEKLWRHFLLQNDPERVITFSSADKFTGAVYEKIGMKKAGISQPGYKWCNNAGTVLSRQSCQKRKLVKRGYDPDKSEVDIMHELNFYRIYDSGNWKFEWIKC